MEISWFIIAIVGFVVLFLSTILFLASRYKRCPSDRILVIYGKVGTNRSSKCMHGGGAIIWPLIQDYEYLSLTPITINIPLHGALSFQNIRINVPSTFTVGISTDPAIMNNAAERVLGLDPQKIEDMAKEIIFGQLRLTVASLTIEQINQDRESFLDAIRKNVEPELNKIGLNLINVNITDITDESEYIESIGRKSVAEAVNKARVDVAEEEKVGAIGEAGANREKTIRVAENQAEAEKGRKKAEANQRIFVQRQEAEAVVGENESKAEMAASNATLAEKEAEARRRAEVALREAQAEIQKAQYQAELERLNAEKVVQSEADKRMVEIAAEAEAERIRREARGQADAILMRYKAEAEGLRQLLESKAQGYRRLVESAGGDTSAAATLLMIEKLDEIVARQVEAIKNIRFDKITVWDSGNHGQGSSTANFLSSLVKSLPPLQDVASMAGVRLPEYLGEMVEKKGEEPARVVEPDSAEKKPEDPRPVGQEPTTEEAPTAES
jgi:flotillin